MTLPHLSFEEKQANSNENSTISESPFAKRCCCLSIQTGCYIHAWINLMLYNGLILFAGYLHFTKNDIPKIDEVPILDSLSMIVLHMLLLKAINYALLILALYKKNVTLLQLFTGVELFSFVICGTMSYIYYAKHPINIYIIVGLIIHNFVSAAMLFIVSSRCTQIKKENDGQCTA